VNDACPENPVSHVRAGTGHACAVRSDGRVQCWGGSTEGQLGVIAAARSEVAPLPGLSGVTDVALGDRHGCALHGDGTVSCWGANDAGQLGDGTTSGSPRPAPAPVPVLGDVIQLVAGEAFTCARRVNGTVACWGRNEDGELGAGSADTSPRATPRDVMLPGGAVALAARYRHACAVGTGGRVWCWGANAQGQRGDGTQTARSLPNEVTGFGGARMATVAAGTSHTCAAAAPASGGGVWCWGANQAGQLGDGGNETRPVPAQVAILSGVTMLAAGGAHTCARARDGSVACWGANQSGQLGLGTFSNSATPVPVTGMVDAAEIAAGATFSCARRLVGSVWCWGDNRLGQLGTGATVDRPEPGRVAVLAGALPPLAAGAAHACARRPAPGGAAATVCWGANQAGQLGDGTRTDRPTPVPLTISLDAREVVAGALHTCLRGGDGSVWCWGRGGSGQLGTPSQIDYVFPTSISGLTGVTRIAAGGAHTCALRGSEVLCWGANDAGQLGDGSTAGRSAPAPVVGAGDAEELALGGAHSCARRRDGSVACWGRGADGQLGDGNAALTSPLPVVVADLTDAVAIAAGDRHTCAVRRGGDAACWGAGQHGQLGSGSIAVGASPAPVMALGGATDIAAGGRHTCALGGDRTVVCWGANDAGQLGNGDPDRKQWLVAPTTSVLTDAVAIAAGGAHTCALRSDGSVACWGNDTSGQLGEGAPLQHATPQPTGVSCP
jgi:alpha-tubulin suppressor-like RCC1 family protein